MDFNANPATGEPSAAQSGSSGASHPTTSRDGRRGPVQNGIVFRDGSLDGNPAAVPKRSGEGCGTAALTGTCGEDSPAGLLQAAATNSSEGTGQGGELGGRSCISGSVVII